MKTKKNMKKNLLQQMIFGAALLIAAGGCTQDELAGDGTQLPEGKYPLQIASVSLSAEVTDEPWSASQAPQTRVAENDNGNSSHWTDGDELGIKIGEDGTPGRYRVDADGTGSVTGVTAIDAAYWTSTAQAAVSAWYPTAETVSLADQSDKLAYVLQATAPNASYDKSLVLSFEHKLAKVRVVVQGDDAQKVTDVKIKSYPSCTHTEGGSITGNGKQDWITMKECNYNGTKCWEANVVPDATIPQLLVNGTNIVDLKNGGIKPLAAKINTITLTAGEMTYNLNDYTSSGTINITGKATITGSPKSQYLQINLKDGADVTLQNVNMEKHYSPITCEGNVTIKLSGTNRITGGNGTLSVSGENSTLTIKEVSPSGSLELKTSDKYSPSALSLEDGANLIIESGNITADASRSELSGNSAAGIGGSCGDITINGGTIIAKGGIGGPGIGAGVYGTCGIITITGGKIEAIGGHGYHGSSIDACGAGIGAGTNASYKEIKISGDATVKATGGCWENDPNRWAYDIGPGYNSSSSCGTVTIENPANVTAAKGRIYGQ